MCRGARRALPHSRYDGSRDPGVHPVTAPTRHLPPPKQLMSLFVLREGYRVVTTRSGARVVHVRTGGSIDLSPEEVLLFARATAGGVDAADPKLRNVIRRFVTLGVLVSTGGTSTSDQDGLKPGAGEARPAPSAPSSPLPDVAAAQPPKVEGSPVVAALSTLIRPPPVPTSSARPAVSASEPVRSPTLQVFSIAQMAPPAPPDNGQPGDNPSSPPRIASRSADDDTVRLMRADLTVRRREASSLLDVTDPRTGKTFPLYDFELSLARMLDGKRLWREVVEAGQRLGIPVDLVSLRQFVSQLDRYGFLASPGTPPSGPGEGQSTWAPRRKWDDGLRALFQSGLRMHRQGRYAEAANYFEAMLQQDPQNPEASEMLGQSRQRMTGTAPTNTEAILSPPDSGQVSLEQLFFDDEDAPPDFPAPLELSPPAPALPPAAKSRTGVWSAERARPPERPRMRWPILAAIGCSMLAVGIPSYVVLKRDSGAKPAPKKPAKAERQQLAAARADGGSPRLAAGESDGGLAVQPRSVERAVGLLAQSALDAGEQGLRAEPTTREPSAAGVLPSTQGTLIAQRLATPDAGIVAAEPGREWIAAKVENRGRVTMAQVAAPASGILSWTASPNKRVRRGETIGILRENRTLHDRSLVAPKEGLFIPKVQSNDAVSFEQPVADIVYHEAYLQASLADARPQSSWSCEVYQADSAERAGCKIVEVVRRGSKSRVTATTEPLWFDTAPDARVRLAPPQ